MSGVNESVLALGKASAILFTKMWFCGTATTYFRGLTNQSANKEDQSVIRFFNILYFIPNNKEFKTLPTNEEPDAMVNRFNRLCNNDSANIPISLIVLAFVAQSNAMPVDLFRNVLWTFVGMRFAHSFFYAFGIQPFRTISYAISCLSVLFAASYLF
eukprot:Nk52_evm1s73 gene=Nk52_evmTU1s73